MEALIRDVRYGVRLLRKQPMITAMAVVILALGIGANTAIFSVVNAVLIRPLPYDKPRDLVWIWNNNRSSGVEREPLSFPNFVDFRNQNQSFDDVAAFTPWLPILAHDEEPERIRASQVSAGFFPVLRAEAALGRTFSPEEDRPGKNRVAVISDGLWKRRYGSDRGIVGKPITLDGNVYTLVGVLREGFQHPAPDEGTPTDLWIPLGLEASGMQRRADFLSVIARLKASSTLDQARADMDALAARLDKEYPDANAGWRVTIIPLHERLVGDLRPAMTFLLGAVAFLLLIACANVANLLLVKSTARQKEMAIRRALGAGRQRLMRQCLSEAVVLSVASGSLAVLLASWAVSLLIGLSPKDIPRIQEATIDLRVLGVTLAVSLLTGIIFGLIPALQSSNPDLNESLKEGGRSMIGGSHRVRSLLMVVEVATALVLLIGAGLMVKSFMRLQRVKPGFEPQRVLALDLSLPRTKYGERHQVKSFYQGLIERVESLPGVQAAGMITFLPLTGRVAVRNIEVVGMAPLPEGHVIGAQWLVVSSSYFRAMGIPVLRGRLFDDRDSENAPGVIVINDVMAERYWPGEDPLEKRISLVDAKTGPWLTVIGVVGDIRQLGLDSEPYPQMYQVLTQVPSWRSSLVVRAVSDPISLTSAIRTRLAEIDRDQPLYNVRTMDRILGESISGPRFNMVLISIFTAVALILAGVGIYGVISYSVSQRAHEIGLRMAIGARERDILGMVAGQGLRLILLGVAIGILSSLLLAFVLTRVLSSLLFRVGGTDPVTFVSVSALLVGIALAACYVPARRAARLDPMSVLRRE